MGYQLIYHVLVVIESHVKIYELYLKYEFIIMKANSKILR